MPKYTPLAVFLRRQKRIEVDLTFRDIERIVGGILPKAAAVDGWWRADPEGSPMPQHIAFADAGFDTVLSIAALCFVPDWPSAIAVRRRAA